MNKQQFIDYHRSAIERMHDTMLKKNADYTGNSSDPFANFTLVEASNICTTEAGILVRMTDKMSRIASLIQNGGKAQVADESIVDTLLDLGNYAIILAARMQSKQPAVTFTINSTTAVQGGGSNSFTAKLDVPATKTI